jgi:hypothetical protein
MRMLRLIVVALGFAVAAASPLVASGVASAEGSAGGE